MNRLKLFYTEDLGMNRLKQIILLLLAIVWSAAVLAAEDTNSAQPPPEIVIDAPPPIQSPVKQKAVETETVTIYESNVLPGFRPCTPEDYHNHDSDPVACQDEENARIISTRDRSKQSEDLIVKDDAVPQGNIYKLKFERFKRKKAK